jgi:hypothetical protein
MVSPPKGTVLLVNSPLSKDNEHQIKFKSISDQRDYFNNLGGVSFPYNYVRHENTMIINCDYYTAIKYNYVVYQNTYVNEKWFFCFIDKFEYVNKDTTKLYLKFDVWQTWQFDIDFQKSFIERSHTQNDEQNTLSDNPSTGNLIEYKSYQKNFTGGYFIFCNADVTQEDTTNSNGYDFKLGNFSVPSMVLFYREDQASSMAIDLQRIANKGYGDRIVSAVYVPCCNLISSLVVDSVNNYPVCRGTNYPDELLKQTVSFDYSDISLGHEKCLTFPYAKIIVQDLTTGQTIELEPNKFGSKNISFEIQSTISETPSYRIIPLGYKNLDKSYSDSLVVKCNTSLPIANNTYAKYLLNNQDFNALRMAGSSIGIAGSVMAGSAMGAITGFESITNVLLQEQQAQKQPNQLSNITDGALERMTFQNGIRISLFVMDEDHRQMANDYWTLFGYPKRVLEYPVFYSTLDYQFMKTQSANINGNIPQDDLVEIQNMFNRGVTIWKADKFRQY